MIITTQISNVQRKSNRSKQPSTTGTIIAKRSNQRLQSHKPSRRSKNQSPPRKRLRKPRRRRRKVGKSDGNDKRIVVPQSLRVISKTPLRKNARILKTSSVITAIRKAVYRAKKAKKAKKLAAAVLATTTLITTNLEADASSKAVSLQQVPYIWYLVQFNKGQPEVQALINFNNEVNIITPGFISNLDLSI